MNPCLDSINSMLPKTLLKQVRNDIFVFIYSKKLKLDELKKKRDRNEVYGTVAQLVERLFRI